MKPEVKKIEHSILPRHKETGLPHIKRVFVRPPGMEHPEILDRYKLYKPEEIQEAIRNAPENEISTGGKQLLNGLLQFGGVGMFGTETDFDLGIDYDKLYKTKYKNKFVNPALQELANQMLQEADKEEYAIDGVLAPENSGIKQAAFFAAYLHDVDCISVKKNGHTSPFAVAVDSYTQGKTDIISIASDIFSSMREEGQTNLVLSDDIIDSGVMTQAVALILQFAQEAHFDINLVGVVTPIEKTYTHARETIREKLGDIPIFSSLKIEDIGLLSETEAWIKIKGIEKAIPCMLNDSRIKREKAL